MIDLAGLTKSNVSVFGASWKSKKFSLVSVWTVAALGFPAEIPPWTACAVIAAYVLGQSFVEAAAAWGASVVVVENGDTPAPAATITAAKPVGGTGG